MTGTEYAVVRALPPKLFVIAKQERRSPQAATVSDYYYILDGSVFMAPTLHAALRMRLVAFPLGSGRWLMEMADFEHALSGPGAGLCQAAHLLQRQQLPIQGRRHGVGFPAGAAAVLSCCPGRTGSHNTPGSPRCSPRRCSIAPDHCINVCVITIRGGPHRRTFLSLDSHTWLIILECPTVLVDHSLTPRAMRPPRRSGRVPAPRWRPGP